MDIATMGNAVSGITATDIQIVCEYLKIICHSLTLITFFQGYEFIMRRLDILKYLQKGSIKK